MPSVNPVLVTPATATAISLGDVKTHLRIDEDDTAHDAILQPLTDAAIAEFEDVTGRALMLSTWDYWLEEWKGDCIDLPKGQLSSVTYLKYYTRAGVETTFSTDYYEVDDIEGSIELKCGYYWPSVELRVSKPIVARFIAGWASPQVLPADIRAALLFRVQQNFEPQRNQTEYDRLNAIWDGTVARWRLW